MGTYFTTGRPVRAAIAAAALWLGLSAGQWAAGAEDSPAAQGPAVGDRAPDFELRDAAGKKRSLAEFRGKQAVALVFYPAMFRQGG